MCQSCHLQVAVRCGDTEGVLNLQTNQVQCQCAACVAIGPDAAMVSASTFEKHSGKEASRSWRNSVRVIEGCQPGTRSRLCWLPLHICINPVRSVFNCVCAWIELHSVAFTQIIRLGGDDRCKHSFRQSGRVLHCHSYSWRFLQNLRPMA